MKSHIVNVLDTEWTCYPDGVFPPGESPEVIEFGLCTVNLKLRQIVKRVSLPVFPTKSKVSAYCTELTGWTYDQLRKQGTTFAEACRRLAEKHAAGGRLLVVDTDDEAPKVREQCAGFGVVYPFGEATLNVSTLFALLTGERSNLGLPAMLQKLELTFEGRRHFGYDDSYNEARLFLALLERGAIKL